MSMVQIASQAEALGLVTHSSDDPLESLRGIQAGGGGVLPYMGYIGMCGAKGYGFSAVLVINRVSILALLPPFWS